MKAQQKIDTLQKLVAQLYQDAQLQVQVKDAQQAPLKNPNSIKIHKNQMGQQQQKQKAQNIITLE